MKPVHLAFLPAFPGNTSTHESPQTAENPSSATVDAIAAYQPAAPSPSPDNHHIPSDGTSRTKRSAAIETIDEIEHVPFDMDDFGNGLRQKFDEIINKIKGMVVLKIDIIGYAPLASEFGAMRSRTVRDYFVSKGVPRDLINVQGRGNLSGMALKGGVKIEITGAPRPQPATVPAAPPPQAVHAPAETPAPHHATPQSGVPATADVPTPAVKSVSVPAADGAQRIKLTDKKELTQEIHQVPLDRRDFDSSIWQPLDLILEQLKNRKISHFEITGYSQNSEQDASSRANAVKDYFIRKGIDAKMITVEGRHNSYPLAQKDAVKIEIQSWAREALNTDDQASRDKRHASPDLAMIQA